MSLNFVKLLLFHIFFNSFAPYRGLVQRSGSEVVLSPPPGLNWTSSSEIISFS